MANEIANMESTRLAEPQRDTRAFIAAFAGSNVLALFVGGIYEYLALRGVVSMRLAWVVLVLVWVVGVVGIVISEWVWGRGMPHRIRWGIIASIVLACCLFGFHKWVTVLTTTKDNPPVVGTDPTKDCSGATGPATANGTGNIANSGNCNDLGNGGQISPKSE